MSNFLIIIPAYNEEKNIINVLEGILDLKIAADILVINDGSKDQTAKVALQYPVFVISHPVNLGYGAAIQSGFQFAAQRHYNYVIQFDSDGQHIPSDIPAIMEELLKGNSDIVLGSRYLSDTPLRSGFLKRLAVLFFRSLIRILTGQTVTDPTSGLRGISRNVFQYFSVSGRFPADYPDADIMIEMILNRFRIQEIPAHMKHREQGVSMHTGIRPILYMFKIMLSILVVMIRHLMMKKVWK